MIVVSNASPLITFARIGQFAKLQKLFPIVTISPQVFDEVVVGGAGKPGSSTIGSAEWIQVRAIQDSDGFSRALTTKALGAGEISAVFLAKELKADLVLMDEWKGRRMAVESGLNVVGCIGLLEVLFRRGEIESLLACYEEMIRQGIRVDLRMLQASLRRFNLPGI